MRARARPSSRLRLRFSSSLLVYLARLFCDVSQPALFCSLPAGEAAPGAQLGAVQIERPDPHDADCGEPGEERDAAVDARRRAKEGRRAVYDAGGELQEEKRERKVSSSGPRSKVESEEGRGGRTVERTKSLPARTDAAYLWYDRMR